MIRLELRKLRALKRTYLGLAAAATIPVILLIALQVGDGGPHDGTPFARAVTASGFAIPLFSLSFASFFLLPLLASLVAGDVVSGEVQGGTLKTILTRSVSRSRIFGAKLGSTAVYVLVMMAAQAVVGTVAGVLVVGAGPLPTLSGTTVAGWHAVAVIVLAFLVAAMTVMAISAFAVMLSALTLSTVAAIGGTVVLIVVLQVMASFDSLAFLRPYLVTERSNAWFAVVRDPIDWPEVRRAFIVDASWAIPCILVGWYSFIRRDVLG